ncbi:MAG: DNA polymerase-3 subunit epsilon [Ilumatobacter sp.]
MAHCPCSGTADPAEYARAVEIARRTMTGDPAIVVSRLHDKMAALAAQQRFEEAAVMRDRLQTLLGAIKRHRLVETLRSADRVTITIGDSTWVVDQGRLVDVAQRGTVGRALPVEPPVATALGTPLPREAIDEALVLAKFFEKRADDLFATCTGDWDFPVAAIDKVQPIHRTHADQQRQAS